MLNRFGEMHKSRSALPDLHSISYAPVNWIGNRHAQLTYNEVEYDIGWRCPINSYTRAPWVPGYSSGIGALCAGGWRVLRRSRSADSTHGTSPGDDASEEDLLPNPGQFTTRAAYTRDDLGVMPQVRLSRAGG